MGNDVLIYRAPKSILLELLRSNKKRSISKVIKNCDITQSYGSFLVRNLEKIKLIKTQPINNISKTPILTKKGEEIALHFLQIDDLLLNKQKNAPEWLQTRTTRL